MISPEEALQTILNVAQRLPPISVPIHDALDKVLAEDIRAPDPLPPYRASIKVPSDFFNSFLRGLLVTFLLFICWCAFAKAEMSCYIFSS